MNVPVAVALSDSFKQIDRVSGADVRGRTGQGVGHQSLRVIPPSQAETSGKVSEDVVSIGENER
jgi:hypothetical protein